MNDSQTNIFEQLKAYKENFPDTEYRRMFATITAANYIVERCGNKDSFTRRDIKRHTDKRMKQEGLEPYSYEFFRKW